MPMRVGYRLWAASATFSRTPSVEALSRRKGGDVLALGRNRIRALRPSSKQFKV
jgi:hypothetical protein